MNDTATLREKIRTITGTFRAVDFYDIPNAHAILTKMVRNGEVLLVEDKRPKVYKVGKLKTHAPRAAPKAISKRVEKMNEVSPFVKAWSAVWPEYFTVPEFGGHKSMVRIHRE